MTYVTQDHLGLHYQRGRVGWKRISRVRYLELLAQGARIWSDDDRAFKAGLDRELDAHLTALYQR